jgi:hypothetical protein
MIPAVYVTIEDQSLILPTLNTNRSVFSVILSDRGPHNRVVQIDSLDQFHRLYGRPNIERTPQTNFFIDKALRQGARCYVIRPAVTDSSVEDTNCSISNAVIYFNKPDGSARQVSGNFFFSNLNDVHFVVDSTSLSNLSFGSSNILNDIYNVDDLPLFDSSLTPTINDSLLEETSTSSGLNTLAKYVYCNSDGYNSIIVGDHITSINDGTEYKNLVIRKEIITLGTTQYHRLVLKYPYMGSTTKIRNSGGALIPAITQREILYTGTFIPNVTFINNCNYAIIDNTTFSNFGTSVFPTYSWICKNTDDSSKARCCLAAVDGNTTPLARKQKIRLKFRADNNGDLHQQGFVIGVPNNGSTAINYYNIYFNTSSSAVAAPSIPAPYDSNLISMSASVTPISISIYNNMSAYDIMLAVQTELTSGSAASISGLLGLIDNVPPAVIDQDILEIVADNDGLVYNPTLPHFAAINNGGLAENPNIVQLGITLNSKYLSLNYKYEGSSSSISGDNIKVIDPDPSRLFGISTDLITNTTEDFNILKYYVGTEKVVEPSYILKYKFTNNSKDVICLDINSYNILKEGDWIYPIFDTAQPELYANTKRQIIRKEIIGSVSPTYKLILDQNYVNTASISFTTYYEINKSQPIIVDSRNNLRYEPSTNAGGADPSDPNIIFEFLGIGIGSFYNNIKIVGYRNTSLEKLFIDKQNNPQYKYAFATIYIYEERPNEEDLLVEGPWDVSLINKTKDGTIIRNINSGEELFISSVINRYSNIIRCYYGTGADRLLSDDDAETLRLMVLTELAKGKSTTKLSTYFSDNIGIKLDKGEDGNQYDSQGRLNLDGNSDLVGAIASAYNGSLTSTDGSIESLPQTIYGIYFFDYIVTGGWAGTFRELSSNSVLNINSHMFSSALELADLRMDVLVIGDTGDNNTTSKDLLARQNSYLENSFNAMLYSQYRQIIEPYTARPIWISPVYHAIERHLAVDRQYWIAEPVANIEKGALQEAAELRYKPNLAGLEDLMDAEVNPTLSEPDGKYFITQLTCWKRLSAMKRAHVVKFVHYVKKELPKLLKDILQRKATPFWINQANARINGFMSKFVQGSAPTDIYTAIKSFSSQVQYDSLRQELNVILMIDPVDVIETINVRIIVV